MGRPRAGPLALLLPCLLLAPFASAQSYVANVRDMGNVLNSCPQGWTFGTQPACMFRALSPLPYRDYAQYLIDLPAAVAGTFDLVVTVVSNEGDVDIRLLSPDKSVLASSTERIGEDVVIGRRAQLAKAPGAYLLSVQAVGGALSSYTITVQGVLSAPRLAASEVALLRSVMAQCCAIEDDDLLPDACTRLRAATAANATAEDDLCAQPPNVCDAAGHLTKLVLSGGDKGNFVCDEFPRELGQLTALNALDWTNNGQVGTLDSVSSVLAPLLSGGKLKRLYFGANSLSGALTCGLVATAGLEVLWLDANLLSGSVPACMFSSPSLLQLSLAGNLLTGPLPELPPGCALASLDLSDNGPYGGGSGTGFTGSLPASITNAANLRYLDVSSNGLSGPLPALPSKLQTLKAASNRLSGTVPASLDRADDLRTLDLSRNQLTGTLSKEITDNDLLMVLRLAGNKLDGELPFSGWGDYLVDVDLSENNFSGVYTKLWYQRSLIRLNLAHNNLSLNMQDVALGLTSGNNSLLYFNVSHNAISGELMPALGRLRMFNQLQLQPDDVDALSASAAESAPQPVFDISHNLINSSYPLWLLPLLGQLYWQSPYDWIPLSLVLQPQQPPPAKDPHGATPALLCPPANSQPPSNDYLEELQALYDLSCKTNFNQLVNISAYNDRSLRPMRPPKPPGPPRPPPPSPPRPPRRRANTTSNSTSDAGGSGSSTVGDDGSVQKGDANSGGGGGNIDTSGSGGVTGGGTDTGAGGGGSSEAGDTGGTGGSGTVQPDSTKSKSGGGGIGIIAGAAAGGAVLLIVAALFGWWYYRRRQTRGAAYAAKRLPLTHNTVYEPAPSDGTASNYADMQMFEFKTTDRPARHRARA